MTTAAVWDSVSIDGVSVRGVPGRAGVARRPRLVVIEGGRGRSAPSDRLRRSLTLPRSVRLAMTLSVLGVMVLGLAATLLLGAGAAVGSPGPIGSIEVRPGQTLSEIARAEMPGLATAEAVARIQLANNLPSSQVTAGQVVVIPGY